MLYVSYELAHTGRSLTACLLSNVLLLCLVSVFSYLRVTQPYVTYKCETELEGFRHIYNAIFCAVFVAIWIYEPLDSVLAIGYN